MTQAPAIREEQLKNRVAAFYFAKFDCTRIVGNIDFCACARRRDPRQILRRGAMFLLAALLATGAASGATLRPSVDVPFGFADTESVTNVAIRAEALADARTFTGSIEIDATVSNAVEVAFGTAGFGGTLAPGAETFAVGWDAGRWFFGTATERIESSEIAEPGRRTLSFSVRVPAFGPPRDLSIFADGAGSAFTELIAAPPEWLFSRNWNVIRLTTRGVDNPDESIAVRFATAPGMLMLK